MDRQVVRRRVANFTILLNYKIMSQIIWTTEKRKVADLKEWDKNPRKISKEAMSKLIDRIKKRGFHDIIKIDVDNTVLSGNQRKKALVAMKIEEIDVRVPNRALTEQERDQVALESNISDGEWDYGALGSFEEDILAEAGFSSAEMDKAFENKKEENFDVEKSVEENKKPNIKIGDLFKCGEHYLICGSSTDETVVRHLMKDEKAKVLFSSPPYNMGSNMYQDYEDDLKSEEYIDFNLNIIREWKKYLKGFIFGISAITEILGGNF